MKRFKVKLPHKLPIILIYLLCIAGATLASRWIAYQVLSLVYAYWPVLNPSTASDLFAVVVTVVSAAILILLKVKRPKI